jgi:peptide/nickel transport system permease protein
MTVYLVRRLLMGILIVVLVTIMIFLIMRLLPGDPLMLYISQNEAGSLSPVQIEALKHKFGLDQSLPMQYISWMGGVIRGDLGTSLFFSEKVTTLIKQRLPISVHLGVLAFIFSGILGIGSGVICALRRGTWIDNLVTVMANVGITIPAFWAGIILIYFLALKAGWLPVYGYTSPFDDFWMSTKQVIMPVICLALFPVASLCRQTRSAMLEVIHQDYMRTAWSKGLPERMIILRHALKNALIPVITVMGLHITTIVGGSVLMETVFNISGIGRLITQSILQQDYQVVQACVLIIAIVIVFANLLVDVSYGWFDPRIRYD